MASSETKLEDPYRWLLNGDVEKNTTWKFGAAPSYEGVNKLFEQERTKVYYTLTLFFYYYSRILSFV